MAGGGEEGDCCSRPILRALCAARGVDLAARDNRGWTALRWAREKGEIEVVEILVGGAAE
jgi:ankyrin repeat protein